MNMFNSPTTDKTANFCVAPTQQSNKRFHIQTRVISCKLPFRMRSLLLNPQALMSQITDPKWAFRTRHATDATLHLTLKCLRNGSFCHWSQAHLNTEAEWRTQRGFYIFIYLSFTNQYSHTRDWLSETGHVMGEYKGYMCVQPTVYKLNYKLEPEIIVAICILCAFTCGFQIRLPTVHTRVTSENNDNTMISKGWTLSTIQNALLCVTYIFCSRVQAITIQMCDGQLLQKVSAYSTKPIYTKQYGKKTWWH